MGLIKNLLVLSLFQAQAALAIDRVCQRFPYAELLPLRNYPPAEEYCSRHCKRIVGHNWVLGLTKARSFTSCDRHSNS